MKAAIYTKYGKPEVVTVTEIDKPVPKDNEVLVKVYASTVNRTDCGFRSAEYFISRFWSGLFKPKYKTLGCEFAGQIEAVGKQVTSWKVGDRIFGFNDTKFGGHAEYMTLNETDAFARIPDSFTYTEAAPLTEGAHYALCNIRTAKIKSGQHVLVYGATGAIGSAAVKLLKYFGANVTAVCNTPNVELVKSLGAGTVIDYLKDDFTKVNQTFDFVFDSVGKSSFGQCKPLLKKNGVYISTELGKHSENIFLALFTPIFCSKRVLFPMPSICQKDVEFLKELAENGQFKPVIDRKYRLEQIVEAHKYVDTGQKTGNVIITVQK
ncbi:MAG: NAD(P)-dependent alcohol dehydrogenase [Tannerellaceae bacterium]|jgi:NADPH:quinone reductase-like Zn-dependent oxidoreductase|nr:NAD(P)-dependent alcohol dehydrogenase [Tannerellaceae bacterium]